MNIIFPKDPNVDIYKKMFADILVIGSAGLEFPVEEDKVLMGLWVA